MQIGLSLTPDFVRERLYEQHYQAAVELVKVFKRHGKEPRIYFFHPEICSGERKYVLYRDKRVFYLQSSDGKISPETFREDYGLSGAVQGFKESRQSNQKLCVYPVETVVRRSARVFHRKLPAGTPTQFLAKKFPRDPLRYRQSHLGIHQNPQILPLIPPVVARASSRDNRRRVS
ncbi:hypothetical protein QAD02_021360 [Eretmocerus hayati]|uniref:Uncharacterized protein n=1 Tax=Eretmocerus hayati TaxID=131215 RepID=A0ACC2PQ82_9HYME|nr:hypothetical protein QAD02_021360 [Eretmocerus hayati]